MSAILPSAPAVDRNARRLALALVAGLALLRLLALFSARTDLYVDEAQYWTWSTSLDWGYFSKPPLIAWLIRATTFVAGDQESGVRLAAPLLHAVTAVVVGRIGDRLYGGRAGPLAAVLYATMPAVALSSTLISTDVPLLVAWSLGLLAAVRHGETGSRRSAAALGLAVAIGLNAKYAMAYLVPMVILAFGADPALRRRLAAPRLWAGLALGLLGLVPNALWNAAHGWVTLHHTESNADWGRHGLDPLSMLGFVGTQFGVFGPVLMTVTALAGFGAMRSVRPAADRFLLLTSLPVLAAIMVQALIAEANANWAATAYPAATVLTAGLLADPARRWWCRLALATGAAATLVLLVGPAVAPVLRLPLLGRPFERVLGWRDYAEAVAAGARTTAARTIVATRRGDAAELLYYLRHAPLTLAVPVAADAPPRDHFQMTRPFSPTLPGPGLALYGGAIDLPAGTTATGPELTLPVGRGVAKTRVIHAVPITW